MKLRNTPRILLAAQQRLPRGIWMTAVRTAVDTGDMRRTAEEFGLEPDELRNWVSKERTRY